MREVCRGVHDVVRGYRFLRAAPRLWGWVLAPGAVTLVLLIAGVVAVAAATSPVVAWVTGWIPEAVRGWARGLAWIVVVLGLGIGAAYSFVAVAGAFAGPFGELLSEAVEAHLTGTGSPRFSMLGFARDAMVGWWHAVRRLLGLIAGSILLFALSLVPVVGALASLCVAAWLAARGTAYDCYDAVLARRQFTYAAKLAFLDRHRGRTLGLGGAVAGLLLVPGINLVALGLGVIGATLMTRELDDDA